MKNLLREMGCAIALLSFHQGAIAQSALDLTKLRGNTLTTVMQDSAAKPDMLQKATASVFKDAEINCGSDNTCTFYVAQCKGEEFKLMVDVGEGNINNSSNSSTVIYTGAEQQQSGFNSHLGGVYIKSNHTHTIKIDKDLYEYIKLFIAIAKNPERIKSSLEQANPTVSHELELILSLIVTLEDKCTTNSQR